MPGLHFDKPEPGRYSGRVRGERQDLAGTEGRFSGLAFGPPPSVAPIADDERFRQINFNGKKSGFFYPRRLPAMPEASDSRPAAIPSPIGEVDCSENALFVRKVLREAGLRPSSYRLAPLIRRMPACLRALKADSISAAARLIKQDTAKLAQAVNALLIGTTSFFRDAPVFEQLEKSIVPGILARESSPRVWSIACSDGAELYSAAMLFARSGPLPGSRFLGTDCRASALRTCRRGIYPADATREVPVDLAEMFLIPGKNTVTVDPRLAAMIDWECHDILRDRDLGSWDMILCRNLAIYLDSTTSGRLWEQLSDALRPEGILVVGKAEKPHVPDLHRIGPCIYQKTSKARA